MSQILFDPALFPELVNEILARATPATLAVIGRVSRAWWERVRPHIRAHRPVRFFVVTATFSSMFENAAPGPFTEEIAMTSFQSYGEEIPSRELFIHVVCEAAKGRKSDLFSMRCISLFAVEIDEATFNRNPVPGIQRIALMSFVMPLQK